MTGNKNKQRNQLWKARKRAGLGQKHVAYLLNHKATDQVSRYEKGWRIPGLKLLLQMEIIYGVPARVLYKDLYEELREKIKSRASKLKTLSNVYTLPADEAKLFSEFCAYEELLRNLNISQADGDKVRKHAIVMVRQDTELRQRFQAARPRH